MQDFLTCAYLVTCKDRFFTRSEVGAQLELDAVACLDALMP